MALRATRERVPFLDGLIGYFGGKRNIVRFIAKFVRGKTFGDAFLGGGAVSVYMKALGYQVSACDRGFVNEVTGRALLENSTTVVSKEDLNRLFAPIANSGFVFKEYYPDYFSERHAHFLDNAIARAHTVKDEALRNLLLLMLAKFILDIRSFKMFTNIKYMQAYNFKDEEEILHRSGQYYKNFEKTCHEFISEKRLDVNKSVFTNGLINKFSNMDVFDWAKTASFDTIYIDPPYYGSDDYEGYYYLLNLILSNNSWRKLEPSVFNQKDKYVDALDELIRLCYNCGRLIFSYGGYRGMEEVDGIVASIKKHRGSRLEIVEIPVTYSIDKMTADKGKKAREILIISDLEGGSK